MLRNWTLFKEKWSIPAATSVAEDYAVARETVLARQYYVPLPAIGRFHRPQGDLWGEADDSRVLAAVAGAIEGGRVEALAGAFAEAARWVDPHRRYQTRRRLAELVLDAPRRGATDWMALFAAGAGELLAILEEEPREPILLNYLGVLLYELGELRTAEGLFAAAFRLDPALGQARENLAAARKLRSSHTVGGPRGALAARVRALAPRAQRVAKAARPAQGLTLSLCMIVKDEEEFLPACLEAVARRGRRDRGRRHGLDGSHGRDRGVVRRARSCRSRGTARSRMRATSRSSTRRATGSCTWTPTSSSHPARAPSSARCSAGPGARPSTSSRRTTRAARARASRSPTSRCASGATGPSTASQGASTSRRRSRCRTTCPSGSRRRRSGSTTTATSRAASRPRRSRSATSSCSRRRSRRAG